MINLKLEKSPKVHVTSVGSGDIPLVLLHGWGFNSHIWKPVLPALLTGRYRLYQVDLPGFGASDLMLWEQFKDLLLPQLPSQFAVVGWSMGGLFATRLALECQAQVTHLFNITSSPCFVATENWPGITRQDLQTFYSNLIDDPQKTLSQFLRLQLNSNIAQGLCHPELPSLEGLRAGLDVLLQWDFRHQMKELKMPVSYIFGRLDTIVSIKVMQAMQIIYPHFAYHMFSKSAHAPFLSHQEEFMALLNEWIHKE